MSPSAMMAMKEKRDVKPVLLKLGMALVLSFAGFLFSRLGIKRVKPPPRLPPPRSSAVLGGRRVQHNHDQLATKSSSCCRTPDENQEDKSIPKMAVDTSPAGLSPNSKHSAEKDGFLLPEFDELVKGFDFEATNALRFSKEDIEQDKSDAKMPKAFITSEKNDEQEISQLKDMIRILQQNERNREIQLLEYYGLKEQEAFAVELQNRIELANMEVKILSFKIQTLQSENRNLEMQVANHAKTVFELEAAKAKIEVLKEKLRHEAKQSKEQILKLQEKLQKLQDQDINAAACNQDMLEKLQRIKNLECEAKDLRESNLRLEEENSDLAEKLDSTQILANSILEEPEAYAWKQESERLRQENEGVAKEIEQLQSDRCSDLEELVYLRWINACLRYELRNYQFAPGKTIARDLSKTLSPKSEKKAKQLILEYANAEGIEAKAMNIMDFDSGYWSSSQASGDCDDVSTDFSTITKTSFSSKAKIFSKLRKLVQRNDGNNISRERIGSLEDASSLCSTSYPHRVESSTPLKTPSGRYFSYQEVKTSKEGVKEEDSDIGLSYQKITSIVRSSSNFKSSSTRRSSDFRHSLDLFSDSSEKSEFLKYSEV